MYIHSFINKTKITKHVMMWNAPYWSYTVYGIHKSIKMQLKGVNGAKPYSRSIR